MLLKITSVDHDGFCGRDHHPADSDIGQVVLVLGVEVWYTDPLGELRPYRTPGDGHISEESKEAARLAIDDDGDAGGFEGTLSMWTAITADGRVLDLMDFEVEPVRAW